MIFDMDPKFACQLKINQKSFHFRRIQADIFRTPKSVGRIRNQFFSDRVNCEDLSF